MRMMIKILASTAGVAALAAAGPAGAQYYGYQNYGYANPYAYNANVTNMATQRCSMAVQQRLSTRAGLSGVIASMLGARTNTGRVLSVTRITPRRSTVTVRGLATTGRFAGYGPYGVGAYGAVGYGYQPDLTYKCTVDYRGYVRDVDIFRR